jgi:tyrosyl-tRNA synthetase
MSKSLNNAIGVTESPNEIFGKIMSVSDAAMWAYWTLLTDRRPSEIEEMKAAVAGGTLHPKKLKMDLGLQIVSDFHGQAAAFSAQEEFERRFAGAGGAVSAEGLSLGKLFPGEDFFERGIADVLVASGLAASKNIARQKVKEGAVSTSADGQAWTKVISPSEAVCLDVAASVFIRLGKRFVRVTR